MVPFDQTGGPPQGQPQSLRPPMPPGHMQASPSPVMQSVHHQPMNPPPYSHRASAGMPGQPPHYAPMPPPSPAQRQGSFTGAMPTSNAQFSSHPPLHQSQGPMHPMGHPGQMHHPQMSRQHSNNMGMPPIPNQHDPLMSNSSGHGRQPPPPQQQQYMSNPPPPSSGGMSGSWQSERDTPHRREMIQHM